MVRDRGRRLEDDLRFLVDVEAFHDICIKCTDGPVYAYKGILSVRSNVFDEWLASDLVSKQNGNTVLELPVEINTAAMRVVLEYIYTGGLSEGSLTNENVVDAYHAAFHLNLDNLKLMIVTFSNQVVSRNNVEFAAKLLTAAVDKIKPPSNDQFFHGIVFHLSATELDRIPFRSISWKALETLLMYTSNHGNIPFCSTEYSVIRYAILHAAFHVSDDETFTYLKRRLPGEENLAKTTDELDSPPPQRTVNGINVMIVRQDIEKMMRFIDLRRVEGKVIAKTIEPLDVVPFNSLYEAYKHETIFRSALPSKRGTKQGMIAVE